MRSHSIPIAWRNFISNTIHNKLFAALVLSWLYAACSQTVLPLPFNLVPISLQPLPLVFCTSLFGWTAVHAYFLYLAQGALGAPFFSYFGRGLPHLLGPTGGYLWGFLLAMIFIAATKKFCTNSRCLILTQYGLCNIIIFSCGLAQLALFIAGPKLFTVGFYPFLLGDFIIKPILFIWLTQHRRLL